MGRGACTLYAGDLAHADCVIVEGSNMAENHPVAFRWVMKAKLNGAKLIHVDPRFTRTSAVADIHAPIRSGTDIAFLGGLIRYVIENNKYFKDYVVNYTNAATIVDDNFKDTEDLNGVFSGLEAYTGDPINGFLGQYNPASWQYKGTAVGEAGRSAASGQSGEQPVQSGAATQPGGQPSQPPAGQTAQPGQPPTQQPTGGQPQAAAQPSPWDAGIKALLKPPAPQDPTLQDPRCVFQIVRRHFSRYTPEMVEQVTGCPKETFLQVAETLAANSGPDRTSSFAYAIAWTQHTYGVQMIGCAALLQLLLGNMGRPGGGIMALRGHATIQGSTDIPTLYHSIHGYMAAPTALKKHDTLTDYLVTETLPTSYWSNQPKFMVSYLKSMYGDKATAQNDYGYNWHPKITGDHSHMPMMIQMVDGKVKGMLLIGQNPATSLNAQLERKALGKLEWLVVRDIFETESAAFWYNSPEVKSGAVKPEDIKTEVILLPSTAIAEIEGTFTNTQRLLQFHEKAADPPGDARSDAWFTHQLALRLKKLYANSAEPRDEGFKNLTWDFDYDQGQYPTNTRIEGEPDALKIDKELNGYDTKTKQLLTGFAALKDDGSTTCASWIYSGMYPKEGDYAPAHRVPDQDRSLANLGWGFAWPANRRIMYNRASAKPDGTPWSDRKKWIWWDAGQKKWVGNDVPDFYPTKAPDTPANPSAIGPDNSSGADPYIMKADGKGWLFVPSGLVDGPIPTHYEALESAVQNPLYKQQNNPVLKYWKHADNPVSAAGDPRFPYVFTTFRVTEHHLSGVMSRWLPWLASLQPELFVELSPELAQEKGIQNLDFVKISTIRATIRAKALVTRRNRPLMVGGKLMHQVAMPWHWGYMGIATGDVTNNLTSMCGDPNVSIHEGKTLVCNIEKG
jgi:formate dehydrogenase major subunit